MSLPPPRLRDESPSVARLFSALQRDTPDPSLVAKVLELPNRVPAPDPRGPARSLSSAARWLAVGACALTLGGLGWALREAPASSAMETPSAPVVEPNVVRAEEPPSHAAEPPSLSVDDLPSAAESPRPPPARSGAAPVATTPATKPSAATATSSTFHEELALIESARGALTRGDGEACLRTLDRYDERFHGGVLASEAEITRIEALASVGRTDAARAAADRFLAQNGGSPYAGRVRSVLERLRPRGGQPSSSANSEGSRR